MDDLTAWILICHRLEIQDIVSLFKTCRLLVELSVKSGLWSFLMRRDFPEHHQTHLIENYDVWYKDLHQFGAYFLIDGCIHLYPVKVEYILSAKPKAITFEGDCLPTIMTTRKLHASFMPFTCMRLPGQMYVHLDAWKRDEHSEMQDAIRIDYGSRELRFCGSDQPSDVKVDQSGLGRETSQDRPIVSSNLKKFYQSDRQRVVSWIHEHFDVAEITTKDDQVRFNGQLYVGFDLDSFDDDTDIPEHLRILNHGSYDYVLSKYHDDESHMMKVRLWCQWTETSYFLVDGEELPWF